MRSLVVQQKLSRRRDARGLAHTTVELRLQDFAPRWAAPSGERRELPPGAVVLLPAAVRVVVAATARNLAVSHSVPSLFGGGDSWWLFRNGRCLRWRSVPHMGGSPPVSRRWWQLSAAAGDWLGSSWVRAAGRGCWLRAQGEGAVEGCVERREGVVFADAHLAASWGCASRQVRAARPANRSGGAPCPGRPCSRRGDSPPPIHRWGMYVSPRVAAVRNCWGAGRWGGGAARNVAVVELDAVIGVRATASSHSCFSSGLRCWGVGPARLSVSGFWLVVLCCGCDASGGAGWGLWVWGVWLVG